MLENQSKDIKKTILNALHYIAPEVDVNNIKSNLPLREQIDIDSLDFVRLIVRLHENLGVDVPESDYAKLTTLDSFINYFTSHAGS